MKPNIALFAIFFSMPVPLIETPSQYHELRERIVALETHLAAIDTIHALGRPHKSRVEDSDLRDLLPLDDARSDVAYTLRGLAKAAGEWGFRRHAKRHSPQPPTT